MHVLWGALIGLAGLFFLVCGRLKSDFLVYRLMVARSRILWGDKVHGFHQVAGVMMVVFGILVALAWI